MALKLFAAIASALVLFALPAGAERELVHVKVSPLASNARDTSGAARAHKCKPNPKPTPRGDLPPKLKPFSENRLIGEGALWTVDPGVPSYVAGRRIWTVRKQPWFRLEEGELTIDGRRIEGAAGTFHAELPPMDAYPLNLNLNIGPGFIPSSFDFSTGGCWKVTGRLGRSKVILYVYVDDSAAAICADLAANLRGVHASDNAAEQDVATIATDQRAHNCAS